MVELIVPAALIILALAAIRFGHDSRESYASNQDIRADTGYRDESEIVDAAPTTTRPAQAPQLANAHR